MSWEQKELSRCNKKHFSSFLKGFQLPKIVSHLRVHLNKVSRRHTVGMRLARWQNIYKYYIYSLVTTHTKFWNWWTSLHGNRFLFSKKWNWSILQSFRRINNKNNTKRPSSKKSATSNKNVWNTSSKVCCNILSKVSFKMPSWDGKVRTLLFATSCKSFNKHLV